MRGGHFVWRERGLNIIFFREEFEELCKDLLERVSMPILAALKKSGMSRDSHMISHRSL